MFVLRQPGSALDNLLLIISVIFLGPYQMGLTNPSLALGRFLQLSTFQKLLTLSDIPLFSTNFLRVASILALHSGLNLSFLTGVLV